MIKRLAKTRFFYVHSCRSLESSKVFAEMMSVSFGGSISVKYRSNFSCSIISIPASKQVESTDSPRSSFGGITLHHLNPQSYRVH